MYMPMLCQALAATSSEATAAGRADFADLCLPMVNEKAAPVVGCYPEPYPTATPKKTLIKKNFN
jgi:hypothetical protein